MLELFFKSKTEYIYIEYTLNKHIIALLCFLLTLSAIFDAFNPITMERLIGHIPNNTTIILNGVSCYCPKTIYVNFYLFFVFFINLPMFRSIIRIKLCHYCILQLHQYNCTPKPPEPSHNPKDIHRKQFPMLKYNSDVCILCCN